MVILLNVIMIMLAFIVGMCAFSFANVVIFRVPNEVSLKTHMYCESCSENLKFYETIPVFSYIFLKGRCKRCGASIRVREFVNELIGGFLSVFILLRFGVNPVLTDTFRMNEILDISLGQFNFSLATVVKLLGIITILAYVVMLDIITLVDNDTMIIYDGFNIVVFVISIISIFTMPGMGIVERIIGIFVVSVPMYIIQLVIPNAFGGGDIKYLAASGLLLGWKLELVGVLIGILLGGFYGMYLMAAKNYDRKTHFAFGPFLCIGVLTAMFIGQDIIELYSQYIAWMKSDY
ncbi:MAG: prepilin peptidase [Lachnospiraceae bacterium]|nr:prepilin peptidase [Lachnospiraceae bacterium]